MLVFTPLLLCFFVTKSFSFNFPSQQCPRGRNSWSRFAVTDRRMGELTQPEQVVYEIMREVSESGFSFRVVVVGKGAILESNVPLLGPVVKVTQSPFTGANMLTMAFLDKSFEFRVKLEQVRKVVLVEKETPAKTFRIIRLLDDDGESISSLILTDTSDGALNWYHNMIEKHGSDIQL